MAIVSTNTTQPNEFATLKSTQTFIIPVANMDTAHSLLEVAARLLQLAKGHIILLYVVTDDDETIASKTAEFRMLIETSRHWTKQSHIELKLQYADSVVDGILDAAQQYDAEMILLGLNYSIRGQVELGPIVETVAERATCDVAVYRSSVHSNIGRIIVPVGGSRASRVILKIGNRLARSYGVPCQALHVFSNGRQSDAYRHVEKLMAMLDDSRHVTASVTQGVNEADAVLSWADENDLMVIGFSERNPMQKWLYGDTAQRLLDRARGPVLMIARAIDNAEIQALTRRRLSWLRPLLTETDQEHLVWMAKDTVLPTLDYFVLLVVAALLASHGLLLNSSAVVIGAMLVAPLMQPIIVMGIALCTARLNLMRKAAVTTGLSVVLAMGIGFLAGVVISPDRPTDEMLGRAYPSLLDAGVAFGSGFIGAYATARKDIPAALAGVAIAAALVPPICTVGLSLALSEGRLAIGAGMLFLTNLVSITVVAAVVFFWMGMRPTRLDNKSRRSRYGLLLASILLMLFTISSTLTYTQRPTLERVSTIRLQTLLEPAELVNLRIRHQDPLLVIATVRTATDLSPETVKMAQVMLSEDLDAQVRLRIIVQRVIDSG